MAEGLTLAIELKGDREASSRFEQAGSDVRKAIVRVFDAIGAEIVTGARSRWPASKGSNTIRHRVYDGARNKGTGTIKLIVDNYPRTFRWVQQFEEGTVGTAGPEADSPAVRGRTGQIVRAHNRGTGRGPKERIQTLVGKRRKMVWRTFKGRVSVRSYHRTQSPMPRRSYMAPAFDAVRGSILPRVSEAISEAIQAETLRGVA